MHTHTHTHTHVWPEWTFLSLRMSVGIEVAPVTTLTAIMSCCSCRLFHLVALNGARTCSRPFKFTWSVLAWLLCWVKSIWFKVFYCSTYMCGHTHTHNHTLWTHTHTRLALSAYSLVKMSFHKNFLKGTGKKQPSHASLQNTEWSFLHKVQEEHIGTTGILGDLNQPYLSTQSHVKVHKSEILLTQNSTSEDWVSHTSR